MTLKLASLAGVLVLTVSMSTAAAGAEKGAERPDEAPYAVMVGDAAPPLSVSRWFKRGPSDSVRPGQPYVVEFWATWCLPCIANVPHLTELQERYKDKATIVGIAVWEPDPAKTESFITRQGEKMKYLVGLDEVPPAPAGDTNARMWAYEQGRMSRAWLADSGQDTIPVAFIVNAEGRIAWIGNPRQMDGPLAQIVEGRWDLDTFAADYRRDMSAQAKAAPIVKRLNEARKAKDAAGALAAADELIGLGPTMATHAGDKFDVLLTDFNDVPRAYAFAREAISGAARDNHRALNGIAAVILRQPAGARRDLDVALAAVRRSEEVTKGKHSRTLNFLAEVHAARGEYAQAVAVQRRAVEAAYPEEKPLFEQTLAAYERKNRP